MVEKTIEKIPLGKIIPSAVQPRGEKFDDDALIELAHSIVNLGLIQPVVVVPIEDDDGFTTAYELVAGERRVRASVAIALQAVFPDHTFDDYVRRLASVGLHGLNGGEHLALGVGDDTIEAIIRNPAERKQLQIATLAENIAREDLTPVEEGRAFKRLMEQQHLTQREMAGQIGVSQAFISQRVSLLELPEAVQQAVITRTITIAHSRAIATLPDVIQEEATPIVAKWVDDGATTRVVESRIKRAMKVLDRQRWTPNPKTEYGPADLNNLRMVSAAVREPGPKAVERILDHAAKDGRSTLDYSVKEIIGYDYYAGRILEALDVDRDEALQNAGLVCEDCIFGGLEPPCKEFRSQTAYCPRWNDADVDGCTQYIGLDEDVLIRANWSVIVACPDEYKTKIKNSDYIIDLDAYLDAFIKTNTATDDDGEPVSKLDRVKEKIRAYWDFQQQLDNVVLGHCQAHACQYCTHYVRDYLDEDMPPCAFCVNPVCDTSGYKKNEQRAPDFGVLIDKDGLLLPRCEMFSRTPDRKFVNPLLYHGTDLGPSRERLLEWIMFIADKMGSQNDRNCLWGVLSWLPYPRKNNRPSIKEAVKYIDENDDLLGGDSGLIVLVDAVRYEAIATASYSSKPFELVNVENGALETWMSYEFPIVDRSWMTSRWPEDWPKPWELVKNEEDEG